MVALSEYVIDQEIHENKRIRVFRGRKAQDGSPVVIKALKEEASGPSEISRLINEYEISRGLEAEGIIKPLWLEQEGMIFALIMEDTGAVSLREYMQSRSVSPGDFLDIAIQLAETLGDIHQQGILHRDLKPENILIHPGTGEVKIIDFSASVRFQREENSPLFPEVPAGTPQYMPPEQTGRMARTADYRGDFYSLGVIFYELLTGRVPWQAGNSAGWMHTHIAKEPELRAAMDSSPEPIRVVVLKLLSKMPEERYQSAYGLVEDLKKCRDRLSRKDSMAPFTPGESDLSMSLQLPGRLYGREKELESLKKAFEAVVAGESRLIFVSGYAGIGKTVLVQEALRCLAAERGCFITGKFDRLRQNMPYSAFAAAFGGLVKQLLTESQEKLDRWKKIIKSALGRNGAVITEVIPEAEWLIGIQPSLDSLSPQEAQNRFHMVFRAFVGALARQEHPLVLFLDDLQWADASSLQLLHYLNRDQDLSCFLCVGAYRDNETNGGHPLTETLKNMRKGGIPLQHIALSCLDYLQVQEFLVDTLHCSAERCGPLAGVLYRQTGGNPFFLGQLLKFIQEEKLLTFHNREGCWDWNLDSLQTLQMENDVVGLILEKLQRLPVHTQDILKTAACMGNHFYLEPLSTVCGLDRSELNRRLWPALREGLVLTSPDNRGKDAEKPTQDAGAEPYEFLHDRVHQAVYSMIPEKEKKERHLKIGRLILESTGREGLPEKILDVMAHLNRGLDLIKDTFIINTCWWLLKQHVFRIKGRRP